MPRNRSGAAGVVQFEARAAASALGPVGHDEARATREVPEVLRERLGGAAVAVQRGDHRQRLVVRRTDIMRVRAGKHEQIVSERMMPARRPSQFRRRVKRKPRRRLGSAPRRDVSRKQISAAGARACAVQPGGQLSSGYVRTSNQGIHRANADTITPAQYQPRSASSLIGSPLPFS